jgi:hypothetical protein
MARHLGMAPRAELVEAILERYRSSIVRPDTKFPTVPADRIRIGVLHDQTRNSPFARPLHHRLPDETLHEAPSLQHPSRSPLPRPASAHPPATASTRTHACPRTGKLHAGVDVPTRSRVSGTARSSRCSNPPRARAGCPQPRQIARRHSQSACPSWAVPCRQSPG